MLFTLFIYLFFTNIGIYMLHMQIICFQVAQKPSFFSSRFFFFNAILATILHSWFAFLFFGLNSLFSALGVGTGVGAYGRHTSITLLVSTTSYLISFSRMKCTFFADFCSYHEQYQKLACFSRRNRPSY